MNKKNIFTLKNQLKGESAMNNLNEKALYMYDKMGIFTVYEYEKNGDIFYATKGCYEFIDMSFKELEDFLISEYEDELKTLDS